MSTSASAHVPGVFAIGDLARFHDPVAGHRHLIQHWTNATYHGERLGRALAGETAPYDQVAYFFTEVFGIKLGLLGDLDAGHDQLIVRGSLEEGLIGFYLDGGRLVAALIVGQSRETQDELTQLLRNQARLERPAFLTQPDAPPALAFGPAAYPALLNQHGGVSRNEHFGSNVRDTPLAALQVRTAGAVRRPSPRPEGGWRAEPEGTPTVRRTSMRG